MRSGSIIVLNGASCAGKSTLARAIQSCSQLPYLIVALDQYRDGLPHRYRGLNSPEGSTGADGLNVVPVSYNAELLTDIHFGPYGQRVIRGMRSAVVAIAREGINVIVDDLVLEPSFVNHYVELLSGLDVMLVGVKCDLEEMTRREQRREGRFPGTAATTLMKVHTHMEYDLEVDTTHCLPEELAEQVIKAAKDNRRPRAIDKLKSMIEVVAHD